MNVFGKLYSMFGKRRGPSESARVQDTVGSDGKKDDSARYEVIVEMEHPGVLVDEEETRNAVQGKLRGHLYSALCFSESGPDTNSLAPCIRRFFLEDQSDFEPFAGAIKTIGGVVGVKKGNGPWKRTPGEQQAAEEERKQIAKEKQRRVEENDKRRKTELAEFKKLEAETKRSDEDTYGPSSGASRLNEREFEEFLASVEHCQVEAIGIFSDMLAGGFMGYKREFAELSGKDVIPFFERVMNSTLRIPFQRECTFYEIPFSVEYREKNGKKFARLTVGAGKPTFIMANFYLFVRVTK